MYVQNIDTLERRAGIHPDLLVEAHGQFQTSHCITCQKIHSHDYVKGMCTNNPSKKLPKHTCTHAHAHTHTHTHTGVNDELLERSVWVTSGPRDFSGHCDLSCISMKTVTVD